MALSLIAQSRSVIILLAFWRLPYKKGTDPFHQMLNVRNQHNARSIGYVTIVSYITQNVLQPLVANPLVKNIDEDGVTGVVDKVSEYVKTVDGSVTSIDVWGRRALAYPINNDREGTYVLFNAQMAPAAVIELERDLKLSEEIMRYMLINVQS